MLGTGPTLDANFYIFSFWSDLYSTSMVGHTQKTLFKILAWSLYWLWRGVWPEFDYRGVASTHPKAGQHLAGGYWAVLWTVKGDLDYFCKTLNMPWYTSRTPCALCPCNSSDIPWTDFSSAAAWRARVWDNVTWAAQFPNRHVLFQSVLGATVLPDFGCGIQALAPDIMHIKHMGTDAWTYGSVLFLLVYIIMPGTAETNLSEVWDMMLAFYKAHPVGSDRFNRIKLSMFTSSDSSNPRNPKFKFPKLKGRAIEVKHLGHPLMHVFQQKMDSESPVHKQLLLALKASCAMEEVLDAHPTEFKLPTLAADKFESAAMTFLLCINAVSHHFHTSGMKLFNITIKFHYLCHAAMLSRFQNPRLGWNYAGEDMMSKVKKLAASCLRGTPPQLVSAKILRKYTLGMSVRMVRP
jgi:hypothetical protein